MASEFLSPGRVRMGRLGSRPLFSLKILPAPGKLAWTLLYQMAGMEADVDRRVIIGVEIEAYSIESGDNRIGRKLSSPKRGISEYDEGFTRDSSIGTEYNSRPFATVREALFLLRAGLRKYLRTLYEVPYTNQHAHRVPLLVGAWTDRTAGTHLHVSIEGVRMSHREAVSLSNHVHDHLPLLIALGANSPVWGRELTPCESNRILQGTDTYFHPLVRGKLASGKTAEMCYSQALGDKPPTLEIRVPDSNLPQFAVASLCLVKAICMRWLRGGELSNRTRHRDYLRARNDAARQGMRARLCWKGQWMPAQNYLDRFLLLHREELEAMDVPDEIAEVLRLARSGFTGSRIIRDAVRETLRNHPQSWEEHFAERYVRGLQEVLSGNTLADFASALRVRLPRGPRQARLVQLRGPPADPSRRGSATPTNSPFSLITNCTQPR
jgi:hypothetical protein